MWSSRLFWKIFLTYAAVIFVSAGLFVAVISQWTEQLILGQIEERLRSAALLIASDLKDDFLLGPSESLQSYVRQLGGRVDMRITLVDSEGAVIADSEKKTLAEVQTMDNHRTRHELMQAMSQGVGTSERVSPTVGEPFKYVAVRVNGPDAALGTVRASNPLSQIETRVNAIKRLVWSAACLVDVFVLVITYWLVARIMQPVETLTMAAKAVTDGDYSKQIDVPRKDELGFLANAFNEMNDRMSRRVTKLRQTSDRMATVLEGMSEAVLAVGVGEKILFANSAAGRLLGFDAGTAEGKSLTECVNIHTVRHVVREQFGLDRPQHLEIESGLTNEHVLDVSSTKLPGNPCPGVVVVLRDISELRRLESLRQEFIANVSHELKTPLSSIKAYAETLREGAIHDKGYNVEFLSRIEEQADRLHQLILDMLSLARIESGQQTLDIVSVSVASIVDLCIADYREAAKLNRIRLNANSPAQDVRVQVDEEGLRQILNNLIDNAIKYTPAEGTVCVSWEETNDNVEIHVKDTGIGISKEDQDRLFERFFRVDKARSRELGGTGLGLSIVKHLAKSFGGTVGVESEPGRGSCFTVVLPKT